MGSLHPAVEKVCRLPTFGASQFFFSVHLTQPNVLVPLRLAAAVLRQRGLTPDVVR